MMTQLPMTRDRSAPPVISLCAWFLKERLSPDLDRIILPLLTLHPTVRVP